MILYIVTKDLSNQQPMNMKVIFTMGISAFGRNGLATGTSEAMGTAEKRTQKARQLGLSPSCTLGFSNTKLKNTSNTLFFYFSA